LEFEIFMSTKDGEKLPDNFVSLAPVDARKFLDQFALNIQEDPHDDESFEKILLYMHQYLIGLAYNHYTIKGHEAKDLYQEGLIALRFKAIPKFNPHKGMSFLNFAKMCIKRHMITMLNTAMNRKKDQPINRAISLDQEYGDEEGDGGTMLNTMVDDSSYFIDDYCSDEDKRVTIENLKENLSEFESYVLDQYLEGHSYRSMATILTKKLGKKYKEKSVDNALLRIRKKAVIMFDSGDYLPLFSAEEKGEYIDDSEDSRWEDQEGFSNW
jgi:RNA polymerase sporulation-specific sigma factor